MEDNRHIEAFTRMLRENSFSMNMTSFAGILFLLLFG